MSLRPSRLMLAPLLLLGSCAIPNTIDMLDDSGPPPEFGRPTWVRTVAGVGGWVGGIIGGVGSIVLLPITYPVSLLADEGLGEHAADEVMLFPAVGLAAAGHATFGLPADLLDFTFRRLWFDTTPDPVTSYDLVPLEGPEVPRDESDA